MKTTLWILSFIGWFYLLGMILTPYETGERLVGDCKYYETYIRGSDSMYIPSNVLDYKFNKDFIVAKQLPDDWEIQHCKDLYPGSPEEVYYWLIVVSEKRTIGPMTRRQFDDSLTRYHVPQKVHFPPVY